MRVLLTSGLITSHLTSMVAPVVEPIRMTVHELTVGTGRSLAGGLDRLELPHLSLPGVLPA